jgi:hypothetical protein
MQNKHQYDIKGERHGNWVMFWPDGKLNYTESYINGEKVGYYYYVYYTNHTHNFIDEEEEGYVAR